MLRETEISLPIESITPSAECKKNFIDFAKQRVIFFEKTEVADQFKQGWLRKEYGHTTLKERNIGPGEVLIKGLHNSTKLGTQKLTDFKIIINKPSFNIDGEDFSDLIPIVIEHEAYELWYSCKKGYSPIEPHCLAIIAETRLAIEIGISEEKLKRFTYGIHTDKESASSELELIGRVFHKKHWK